MARRSATLLLPFVALLAGCCFTLSSAITCNINDDVTGGLYTDMSKVTQKPSSETKFLACYSATLRVQKAGVTLYLVDNGGYLDVTAPNTCEKRNADLASSTQKLQGCGANGIDCKFNTACCTTNNCNNVLTASAAKIMPAVYVTILAVFGALLMARM